MDPYTPKIRPGSRNRRSNLTLSAKQYTKITGTIASLRRSRQNAEGGENVDSIGNGNREDYDYEDEPSFIAEKSFISAPLNSRVPSLSFSGGGNGSSKLKSKSKGKGKEKAESLEKIPTDIQEALILEDLLFVLMGIEGTYITYPENYSPEDDYSLQGVRFVTSPSLDPSLRDLVERILPLATYYTAISSFVEIRSHLEYGLVNHALCAAVRDMLKDYQTLLSQLEHAFTASPQFTLQKLWFYVHPTLHTLSLIYNLIIDLADAENDNSPSLSEEEDNDEDESEEDEEERARNEALGLGGKNLKAVLRDIQITSVNGAVAGTGGGFVKGGEVLSVLHTKLSSMSGDPAATALYTTLIRAAGKPYVRMLELWIKSGKLEDPYEELCVRESKYVGKEMLGEDFMDEYWERRYTLRDGSTLSSGSSSKRTQQPGVPPPRPSSGRLPGGACVPPLLEAWKHKVLLAGKYLNVMRECGIDVNFRKKIGEKGKGKEEEEELGMDDERFYKSIDQAYTHANLSLLQLLLEKQGLLQHLRILKHYFFIAQSSYLTQFLDLSGSELRKSAKSASLVKLQSLLELVMGGEGAWANVGGGGGDGMMLDMGKVKVTMAQSGLYEWLLKVVSVSGVIGTGKDDAGAGEGEQGHEEKKEKDDKKEKGMLAIDALTLDYTAPFPLSLVISRKTILRYQLLFRFLLHLRHVEQSLCAMWSEHQQPAWRRTIRTPRPVSRLSSRSNPSPIPPPTPDLINPPNPSYLSSSSYVSTQSEFDRWRNRVFLLRARMLAFVQQILSFATVEVLEPNWRKLEEKLASGVRTVDELLRDHVDFLDTCLKECMLTSSKLLRAFSRLIVTCSTFALYSSSFTKSANQALSALEASGGDPASAPMEKRWDFLSKFETNFNHWFKVHLDCVQFYASSENVSLLPLVVRLNSIRTISMT